MAAPIDNSGPTRLLEPLVPSKISKPIRFPKPMLFAGGMIAQFHPKRNFPQILCLPPHLRAGSFGILKALWHPGAWPWGWRGLDGCSQRRNTMFCIKPGPFRFPSAAVPGPNPGITGPRIAVAVCRRFNPPLHHLCYANRLLHFKVNMVLALLRRHLAPAPAVLDKSLNKSAS